jgi:hypothetical protein
MKRQDNDRERPLLPGSRRAAWSFRINPVMLQHIASTLTVQQFNHTLDARSIRGSTCSWSHHD